MYFVARSRSFEKSYRKLKKSGTLKLSVRKSLEEVIVTLSAGTRLQARHLDHQLKGEFKGYRECHIKDDLLLVYRIDEDEGVLVLMDIGSHSQLFG